MADQTAVPTYAELMDRANRAEEKIVRLISEAERTEERLAEELDRARARVTELEDRRDTSRREYHDLHVSCEKRVEERNDARAVIDRVRDALAGHPRCEEHPEGDVIKCGWKRAVASVQAAVDASPARREPVAYTVIHSISAVEVAFTGRYFHDRARAERRAADDGPSYRVVALVELREVGEP